MACVVLAAPMVFAASPELHQPRPDRLILVEPGPIEQAVLHVDGSVIHLQTESVWRYMCGSNTAGLNIEDMRTTVERIQAGFAETRNANNPPAAALGAGLNIVWNIGGGLSSEAQAALETAAQYIERQFGDPITVTISVQMVNFGNPNIIGATSSVYSGAPGWSTVRAGLINDMDGNDTIQDFMPSGATIPVRYNASSATVTNETRVWVTKANFNAAIGASPGTAASMAFNSQFNFDFDPSNGVSGTDFQSVVVHEVGHALGFTSATESRFNDIEMLDIFRFQNTDGAGDHNPDTEAEFATTARTVDFDNLNDDVTSDLISAQYRMEDGNPWQASHFRQSVNAIMDPNIASGQTFFPNFFRAPDLNMFDAIGYDFPALSTPSVPPFPDGAPKNRYISFLPENGSFETAFQVEMTAGPGTLGLLGWVGAPDAEGRAVIVDQPFYTANWPDPVHLGDCEIVPVATYEVRGIILGFDEANPDFFSPSLAISTISQPAPKFWADSAGELVGSVWSGPNGVTNFQDVVAVIQAFQLAPSAPPSTWADIDPEVPNRTVNINDAFATILAFQGATYPYSDPSGCP